MPRRSPAQREAAYALTADLYVRGLPQSEIATRTGVSVRQVGRDLKVVRGRWRDSQVRDFDEAVALQLARLDRLERIAWDAWEQSLQTRQKRTRGTRGSPRGPAVPHAAIVEQNTAGDPRFLDRISWCIQERNRILGLYAPTVTAAAVRLVTSEQELCEQEQRLGLMAPQWRLPHLADERPAASDPREPLALEQPPAEGPPSRQSDQPRDDAPPAALVEQSPTAPKTVDATSSTSTPPIGSADSS